MKKTLFLAALAAVAMACQESLEERAAREVSTFTKKNCPQQLDPSISLDSLTFDAPTHTLTYHHTFQGALDTTAIVRPEVFREGLLASLRNQTSLRVYMNHDYSFRYVYRSQRHPDQVLYETLFEPKDYQ